MRCSNAVALYASDPDRRDHGKKPAQRSVGQTIAVRLPSNPRPDISGASLAFITSDYATDPQAAGRAGAGGTQTLQFTTKSERRGNSSSGRTSLGGGRALGKDLLGDACSQVAADVAFALDDRCVRHRFTGCERTRFRNRLISGHGFTVPKPSNSRSKL